MPALDARADLRAAVRRLLAAVRGHEPEVVVRRRDLEVLLSAASARVVRGVDSAATEPPWLHPEQR